MEPSDPDKKEVRRPMNAFLIFCKRHRSMVREKNPNLDNRNVTRILGDLWANLKEEEKTQYTDLAKQYKDAFMKANPDYKWHNPEKGMHPAGLLPRSPIKEPLDFTRTDQAITPGKLADPSNMGGLSLLFMAGQQNAAKSGAANQSVILPKEKVPSFDSGKTSLSLGPDVSLVEQGLQSSEKEDRGTMVASGKMVMDSIIDQLYYSKSDASSDLEGDETRKGSFTSLADKHKERSLLHDLSVSRDELERKLLLNQQMICGSGMDNAKSSLVGPRDAIPANHAFIKSQMLSWSGYKRKRCYSEGFKDTPEMNTIQPFVNPYYKKTDSSSDVVDDDGDGDFQPVRKSKRRNRGQRYQELINEGIIQPSKERQTSSKSPEEASQGEQRAVQKDGELKEEEHIDLNQREHLRFDVLSVYPRQIRKRTQSESEKVRLEDSSRYKTGDFDLEAHIATLPACSLEKVAKPKKTTPKLRTMSESRTSSVSSDSSSATEIKLTIPPHLKVKAEDIPSEPVIGSRKRKARKHSITHLMPITAENKREVINTDEESLKPTTTEIKDLDNVMTHFTEVKKPKENEDGENDNNEPKNMEETKQLEDSQDVDSCIEPAFSESKVPDVVSPSADNQDNCASSDSHSVVTSTESKGHAAGHVDNLSSDKQENSHSPTADSSLISEEGMEKTVSSLPEVVSRVDSNGPGVDVTSTRECSHDGPVDFDNFSTQSGSEKRITENISSDNNKSKSESSYLSENQENEEQKNDSVVDKQPSPSRNSDSKTSHSTQGLSQSHLGQACGNQVTEVISFHLEESREERSQVTIQNNPLQAAVVNS